MYCVPACKGCKEAGRCPKGDLPASPVSRARRAAVAATAPRAGVERKTYVLLPCNHYTDSASIAFFSVWQPRSDEGPTQLWCETCKKWQPVEVKTAPDPSTLF
jgi:hypothetical protein